MSHGGEEDDAPLNKLQGVAGEEDHNDGTGQTNTILNNLHSQLYFSLHIQRFNELHSHYFRMAMH